MWMTDYVAEIKRGFERIYGFKPERRVGDEPVFGKNQIPDGVYPMKVDGKLDQVAIVDGKISCCNFAK